MGRFDYYLLLVDSFFIPLSFNIVIVAVPLKGLAVGLSEGVVALVIFVSNIVQLFGRPIFGYLSDRFGPKKFISLAALLYSSSFYFFYISKNVLEIFISATLLGLAVSSQWSALFSFLPKLKVRDITDVTGSTLSLSFFGAVVGLFFSGYVVELYGFNFPFILSTVIALSCFFIVLPVRDVEGAKAVSLRNSIKVALSNIGETLGLTNSIAVFPLVRTYGLLLMLMAGFRESLIGLILMTYRLMNALLQKVSAKISSWIQNKIFPLNLLSLLCFSLFAIFLIQGAIITALGFFLLATITNSLLPTLQLSRAISRDRKYSGSGVAGFGTGLSVGRIVATGMGSVAGGYEEVNGLGYPPAFLAFLVPIFFFVGLTISYKLLIKPNINN